MDTGKELTRTSTYMFTLEGLSFNYNVELQPYQNAIDDGFLEGIFPETNRKLKGHPPPEEALAHTDSVASQRRCGRPPSSGEETHLKFAFLTSGTALATNIILVILKLYDTVEAQAVFDIQSMISLRKHPSFS